MAVNCLTKQQQTFLIDSYRNKAMSIAELARRFSISETTVRRIIRDAGEITPELRAKEEARRVAALLKKFNVGYYQLEALLKYRAKNEAIFKALPISTKQQVSMNFKEED